MSPYPTTYNIADPQGIEPRLLPSKGSVLPLDDGSWSGQGDSNPYYLHHKEVCYRYTMYLLIAYHITVLMSSVILSYPQFLKYTLTMMVTWVYNSGAGDGL